MVVCFEILGKKTLKISFYLSPSLPSSALHALVIPVLFHVPLFLFLSKMFLCKYLRMIMNFWPFSLQFPSVDIIAKCHDTQTTNFQIIYCFIFQKYLFLLFNSQFTIITFRHMITSLYAHSEVWWIINWKFPPLFHLKNRIFLKRTKTNKQTKQQSPGLWIYCFWRKTWKNSLLKYWKKS